jgi:photosystem II stability/assembly factor-like uncharacterized protein
LRVFLKRKSVEMSLDAADTSVRATILVAVLCVSALYGADVGEHAFDDISWRSIGPATMGGRISDIAGVPGNPAIVYSASGSGGLFRSNNGGVTWEAIFDHQTTISIGALAISPTDPNVVWVGTGESNVRNSVSFGDGVYKSTDGGKSWKNTGLRDTETISRIVIDPSNTNHVLVSAVGHPFGPNEQRGVFVTNDGGATWKKTLYVDDEHGAVGLEIDPANPQIVYAGLWHFDRKPWTYTSGSEKGGVFKSTDGGNTWRKLTNGLPSLLGRIGIKVAPTNSNEVYVIAESKEGTLFRSHNGGETFEKISDERELVGRAYYFTDMRVAPDSAEHIMVLADALLESSDGGRHFRRMSPRIHGDLHALWIDPKDVRRIWQGNDGGLAVTYDGGKTWEQVNNIPLGQFYHVSADERRPFYNVTVGMQDNGAWTGPATTREPGGIFNDDWRMVTPFTGFNSLADAADPDVIISEQPGGALTRINTRTRETQVVSAQPRSYAGAPASEMKYRFNWDAPLIRSPHGKQTIYLAGNVIFQSSDFGKSWETISRDLTTNDVSKLGNIGGPISIDNSASETYSTITALAESPVKRNMIWAGTDDGNLQVTQDGGSHWTNVAANLPGLKEHSPISHVEPSNANEAVAYASVDRHMFDDMHPYIFKTQDSGKSWVSISANLPGNAFVWTVKEDPREPKLLYAGTELGLYASFDAGAKWVPLHMKNMPWAIAVRDIVFQPQTNDLLIATHGRSLFVLDDAAFLAGVGRAKGDELFAVGPALRHAVRATRFGFGDGNFVGPNPDYGAVITFVLTADAAQAKVEISDGMGDVIRTLPLTPHAGVNRVVWDLRYAAEKGRGPQALPGNYVARLRVADKLWEQKFKVELDPGSPATAEQLRAQFAMLRQILEMQAGVNDAEKKLRATTDVQAKALLGQLRRAGGRGASGPRLRENLDALFNMVDGADAAPTEAQSRYFDELRSQFDGLMKQTETLATNR